MKRFALFCASAACLLAGFGSLQAASDSKDDARQEVIKQDRKKYFGEWEFMSLVVDGNELSAENVKRFKVVNGADGTWSISVDGDIKLQGTSEIDPTRQPKTVDLTVTVGDGAGEKILGIYEFPDGDTRRICFAQQGKERPDEFSSPASSGRILGLLKRIKK